MRLDEAQFRTQTVGNCRIGFRLFIWGMIAQSLLGRTIVSTRAREVGLRIFAILFIFTLFLGGVQLRRWTGQNTRHVRYQHDIVNAFYWGQETLKEARRLSPGDASANSWTGLFRGYLALYDRVKEEAYNNDYGLDYPPLRLLTMAIWSKEVRDGFPWVDNEHPKLVNPLLKINLVCELVSAAAIFFLVRLCVRRSLHAHSTWPAWLSREHRASICGLAAASVAWLEPSMILDAHGWPQWDVWILPFYLFAALARFKKSLVLVRMFAGVGRNAQRTAVVRGAVFCPLAIVAKKMDERAAHARRVHSNRSADSFTMASANSRGLDRIRCCSWCQSFGRLAIQVAA